MASGSQANAAEIDRLALALAKDPASKSFIPLAEEYGKAGMWPEAAGVLEDGLKYYPGFITAMVALGRAYDQMGQPTKAKAILEEAIKISPENLRAHRTLAKIYTAEGSTAAALRSCDAILALNPLDQESLSLRASLGASTPPAAPPSATSVKPPSAQPQVFDTPAPATPAATAEPSIPAPPPVELTIAAVDTQHISPREPETISATPLAVDTAPPDRLTTADTPRPPDVITQQTASVKKLEQLLQSIQTRRRDRPSPDSTTTAFPS